MDLNQAFSQNNLTSKQIAIIILVFFHLVTVALFVWSGSVRNSTNDLVSLGRSYLNLSGSFRDYAYFAPSIANDLRAGFLVEDFDRKTSFIDFVSDNKEIGFRYNSVIASSMGGEKQRDLLAQSWAAFILGNQANAKNVTVVSQAYILPSMQDYQNGKRPAWKTIYLGKFEKK
ncbi:hypothetical protein [Dyadobacter sp. NIV53]|uniref:hypothetical protein n=1 Tax=Dyadobacter sp. NIV53 TaxID=2861765 RepID=UPI001C86D885|nr:hypothetical protein [Dyadobacter sp. NIV53]